MAENLPQRSGPNQLGRPTPRSEVERAMTTMVKALPTDERTIERFKAAAFAIASSPQLADCSPKSVVKVVYECARLNLIPDPIQQHAYIVPFRNRGVKEATLIVGYKGLIELARRAEPQLYVDAGSIYQDDDYLLIEGLEPKFEIRQRWWQKGLEDPGEHLFSYCISYMPGQKPRVVVVSNQEGKAIGKKSKSGMQPGKPWHDNFVMMCEKTAIRRSARLWSLSPTRQEARRLQEAIIADESDEYPDPAETGGDILAGMDEEAAQQAPPQQQAPMPPAGERSFGNASGQRPPAKPVASKTVAAPAPANPMKANPPRSANTRTAAEVKEQIMNALDPKLMGALVDVNDDNRLLALSRIMGLDDVTAVANEFDSAGVAKLLIWLGDINKLSGPELGAMMGVAQAEQNAANEDGAAYEQGMGGIDDLGNGGGNIANDVEQAFEEAASTEQDAVPVFTDLVNKWLEVRKPVVPAMDDARARKAVEKYFKVGRSLNMVNAKPEDFIDAMEKISKGSIRYSLFEG